MKIIKQSLIIFLLAIAAGILFNLFYGSSINPFKSFASDIDISLDPRAIVDLEDVIATFEGQNTVFIDARDEKNYLNEHIPHSLNAPYFYMERAYAFIADKIHLTDTIVFYGANDWDIAPLRSADYYQNLGFKNAKILFGGIAKWKASGLPIDGRNENAQ
jgi:rhodanese-related sulfurtransferase